MAIQTEQVDAMPVVSDPKNFDKNSGNLLERLVFNNRHWLIGICALITILLAFQLSKLVVNASFEKMIPQNHPYIKNYFENKKDLPAAGNNIRVVVENTEGDIFNTNFLETTRQINEELYLTPGVDRPWVKSIWMAGVRWTEVTEEGFRGGAVMPDSYDTPESLQKFNSNIRRAGIVGSLVGNNYKSIMIVLPLMDTNNETGKRLDYGAFSRDLEKIRTKYESASQGKIKIHIIGFAKLAGDLIDGLYLMMIYFAVAAVIAAVIIYTFTRCVRSTLLVIFCSLVAVVWQLGIIATLGYELDPYSVLVPFLIFAIGVSHGAQKMNGIMQDIGRGTHKTVAARYTFRRLFLAGATALMADAVGFGVLMLIDIPVIRDLALTASFGVAILIFTNLLLLPVFLSYTGVSPSAARRALNEDVVESRGRGLGSLWNFLDRFTERTWAIRVIVVSAILAVIGLVVSSQLKIGDLDAGAPELRPDSRYNRDNSFITNNYKLSSDQFVVIVKTPENGAGTYETLYEIDRLSNILRDVPGVQGTTALSDNIMQTVAGLAEGNPKWLAIPNNAMMLGGAVQWNLTDNPDVVDKACSIVPVVVYLTDHKAETLDRVVKVVEQFAAQHNVKERQFLMAAGSSGIDAVTNIVVKRANRTMLLYVYAAVTLLCFITFRNWRAVLVAVIPLMITSILCEALMVALGIGVKVATLPVIALGVGIGVDYALYLLSVQLDYQRAGLTLTAAYKRAVLFTGKVVALVGITLAAGVVTWAWSPIKFQADMGILLTFMFLWNMFGALIMIPALSHFLLNKPVADSETVNMSEVSFATEEEESSVEVQKECSNNY
ncbi:exporter, RND superfamily, putative [Geobacter metallireducens GS-15]|uniref:Exporter, RND superfamily, putative n=1 Tax=Geobacter metallireducens (strain ATCC 53774 / DSM 7210 / GS-15) TaxID=269799 RepID=Q39TF3_GEOMG|nr:MMPL family transporter [Geobacter metallireducens]ABB32471.1 exporter, RND superfamily, putative [Geobacter metallireducens GS-15]